MENITSGCINQDYVKKYLDCIYECDGHANSAINLAYKKYNLNAAYTTSEQDSWHEALARYNN